MSDISYIKLRVNSKQYWIRSNGIEDIDIDDHKKLESVSDYIIDLENSIILKSKNGYSIETLIQRIIELENMVNSKSYSNKRNFENQYTLEESKILSDEFSKNLETLHERSKQSLNKHIWGT